MREDLRIIANLIKRDARVLDLGCGSGDLLEHLAHAKNILGYGIENDTDEIAACIQRGINVVEHDLNEGLRRFPDKSFDMVIMTETLQAVDSPHQLLDEMLRIGEECIVTFPNFGYWGHRVRMLTSGNVPVSQPIPHRWFDTPNIRPCTFLDFEQLCEEKDLRVVQRLVFSSSYKTDSLMKRFPNLFGAIAFYRLGRAS